jgi:hypothetical protein
MGGLVWVASYPRSGNTWTRTFLHSLLNVIERRETLDLNQLGESSTWDISETWYRPFLKKAPNQASMEEVAAVRPMAQRRIADSVNGLVFVKTHAALVKERGTPTIDMSRTAGAVYIVRNPLDVVLSYAQHMNIPIETAVGVLNAPRFETPNGPHSVYEFYGSWSQHVVSWTRRPHHAVFVIRYEDLIADPQANFANMARHLRIEASQEQIEKAAQMSAFERLTAIEAETGFREKPEQSKRFFRKGTAGQWRDGLARPLVDRIVACHGETMSRFGYVP